MNARVALLRSLVVAVGAVVLAGVPASAQESASLIPPAVQPAPARTADAAPASSGPSLEAASVAVRRAPELPAPAAPARTSDAGVKWMVLGGAAILTGIVIGGDAGHAISIGGAVVGLYGLYQYLQ